MKKFMIFFTLALFLYCCQSKEENLIKENNASKSIHQQEMEYYKQHGFDPTKISLTVLKDELLVDGKIGGFRYPQFTNNGNRIFFTNDNFSEIWFYDFVTETIEKIVAFPQCGLNFQISENGNIIYYRNKVTHGKKSYSILSYSIDTKKTDVILTSDKRITTPLLVGSEIFVLEETKPLSINLTNNSVSSTFSNPFLFVENNKLVRVNNKIDTLSIPNDVKAISANYSKDRENIFVLTSNIGILIYDKLGNPINNFKNSVYIQKLLKSSLVVFTNEEYENDRISSSKMYLGFLTSNKSLELFPKEKSNKFYPDWSPTENKIVYITEDGSIRIVSIKIENL